MPDFTHPKHSHLPAPKAGKALVLALESSCDETAASVVCRDADGKGTILSNIVLSQIEEHAALAEAAVAVSDLDAIAATAGPGLNGGLLVATMSAKAMAHALHLPFYPINHLEGHALTARLTDNIAFPYVLLLVSGGHTQIVIVHKVGTYQRIATTIDDALGEAFDKTAKMLGLDYPGGPAVERMAKAGDPHRFDFPRPMQSHDTLNMSLSGLKTAVRLAAEKQAPLSDQDVSDVCSSFQQAISDILCNRIERSLQLFQEHYPDHNSPTLVIAGGVAANQMIRTDLQVVCDTAGVALSAPPLKLCTDNAAMIGWAALERIALGQSGDLTFTPRPRWPLDGESGTVVGTGKRGAKV